jgi:hypothetical protein
MTNKQYCQSHPDIGTQFQCHYDEKQIERKLNPYLIRKTDPVILIISSGNTEEEAWLKLRKRLEKNNF